MDYEKKYKEALEKAKKTLEKSSAKDEAKLVVEYFFPELAENESERIRKSILHKMEACKKQSNFFSEEEISWLEKQKEQKPSSKFRPGDWVVYDGPLGHAILQVEDVIDGRYTFVNNDSTLLEEDSDKFLRPLTPEDVEGKQKPELPLMGGDADTYFDDLRMTTKPLTSREWFNEGIKYAQRLQKEQKPAESRKRNKPKESWLSEAKYEIEHADELLMQRREELREIRELKKKEQESESCEPDTNVEKVIEDVIRVYGKTQGEWVGGYDVDTLIVNLRRAFNKKEQHPSSRFRSGDWVVYDGPLGHAILQIGDVIDGRYTFVDNDSTLLVEDSDEFLRPLTPEDVEKPTEWSDEDEKNLELVTDCIYEFYPDPVMKYKLKDWLKSLRCHWRPNDEDEVRLINTSISFLKDFADKGYENAVECIDWLKSKLNGNTCE